LLQAFGCEERKWENPSLNISTILYNVLGFFFITIENIYCVLLSSRRGFFFRSPALFLSPPLLILKRTFPGIFLYSSNFHAFRGKILPPFPSLIFFSRHIWFGFFLASFSEKLAVGESCLLGKAGG
jgi:hypothetical protein